MTCAQILSRPDFDNAGAAFDWEIKNNQVPYELPVVLPEAAWRDLPDALSELAYGVRHAQAAFDHIQMTLSDSPSADPGIISLVELASRGLKHLSENEGLLIDDVATIMRRAVSKMIADKIGKEGKGKAA